MGRGSNRAVAADTEKGKLALWLEVWCSETQIHMGSYGWIDKEELLFVIILV